VDGDGFRFAVSEAGSDLAAPALSGHLLGLTVADAAARGPQSAADLDGSFALALPGSDSSHAVVVTDRVGSRSVFTGRAGGATVVSTRLADVAAGCAADPAGVASVLANGVPLNGRTPFTGVTKLERACVHTIRPNGVESRPYWSYAFAPDGRSADGRLRGELAERVREAVGRWSPSAPALLSLSAGVDSRTLLALLSRAGRTDGLTSFSYAHGRPKRGSDAALAARLAARYGVAHRLVESYEGALPRTLEANAVLGAGVANLCDEADAWLSLRRESRADVLVGDECFGWRDAPLATDEEVLEIVGIRPWAATAWLGRLLPGSSAAALEEALEAEIEGVRARARAFDDPHDRKDFLYLDQRVAHVLMPWRERFAGTLGRVQMPFLDPRILDFMRGVPSALRRDKRLYRESLEATVPDAFEVPRASRSGYLVNWGLELARWGRALRAEVSTTPSRLDELIPPEVVILLLRRTEGATAPFRYGLKKVGDFAASRPGVAGRAARAAGVRPLRRIDETTVLLRLLVLRRALA
jgi:asparagine synthase (glutamine-hydrolysing)